MGVFDKFLDIMKLNDDEYDDDDFYDDDFEDVRGNYFVKRGVEIAAAGNHNILMMISMKNRIVQFSETRRAEVMILMISIWTRTSILLHPLEIK